MDKSPCSEPGELCSCSEWTAESIPDSTVCAWVWAWEKGCLVVVLPESLPTFFASSVLSPLLCKEQLTSKPNCIHFNYGQIKSSFFVLLLRKPILGKTNGLVETKTQLPGLRGSENWREFCSGLQRFKGQTSSSLASVTISNHNTHHYEYIH